MSMRLSFWQVVFHRLEALVGGFITSRIEQSLVEEEIDEAITIEKKARQLEADGMVDLAAQLRSKYSHISSQPNCGRGQALIADLDENGPAGSRLLSHQPDQTSPAPPQRIRRRRSVAADETSTD